MNTDILIVNVSFCIYPDYKSSEGIVNYNWQNILLKYSSNIHEISQQKEINFRTKEIVKFQFLNYFYKNIKDKKSIVSLVFRITNKVFIFFNKNSSSLYNYMWITKTYNSQKKINKLNNKAVFWVRILPTLGLKPILKLYDKKGCSFVVNVNDPIVIESLKDLDESRYTKDQLLFLETKDKAQAWTFPSSKLADVISHKYMLDRDRCFVIPHANSPFESKYKRKKKKLIKILYAGTFYKSAFTNNFKNALQKIGNNTLYNNVEFTFILSQYDDYSINWLKENIKNLKLYFKLEREEVHDFMRKSDLTLILDAYNHTDLLKGKLVEAISFGIPVFGITYENSIMQKVVNEYGCNSAFQNIEDDIYIKFIDLLEKLDNDVWLENFYNKRDKIFNKFSDGTILALTNKVTEFAYKRFNGEKKCSIINDLN